MTYRAKPFQRARRDVRDLLTTPVQAWLTIPPARRRDKAYTALLTIPLDMAACGYVVSVKQTDAGWCLELTGDIAGHALQVHSEARTYVSCLFTLAEDAATAIDDLQAQARKEARQEESPA